MHRNPRILTAAVVAFAVLLAAVGARTAFALVTVSGTCDIEVPDKTGYATCTIGGTIFEYIGDSNESFGSSGSGVFDPFVRVHADTTEAGYNVAQSGTREFDTVAGVHTHEILVSEIPVVSVGGQPHWELFADINDSDGAAANAALISLNDLEVYFTDDPELTGYDFGADAAKVYDFNGSVTINDVNQGSGRGDLRVTIPLAGITIPAGCEYGGASCTTYFVLYNQWGTTGGDYESDGGFEEWKVKQYASLQIVKNTVGGDATVDFTVSGPTPSTPSITTVGGTGATSVMIVTPGDYEITENLPTGWSFTSAVCSTNGATAVSYTPGSTLEIDDKSPDHVVCTFTNTRDTGSLKITKAFAPGQSGFAGNFAIDYDCDDGVTHDGTANLAAGGTTTITGIPLGTVCTVTEPATPTNPAGWTFGAPTFIDSSNTANDGIVTVTVASPATVDVTVNNSITQNPPETGSLKITKAFDPGQSGFAGTFAINYDCNDGTTHDGTANLAGGGTTTITGIPLGTICTVTEPATPTNPAGWTFGAPTFIDSSNTANDGIVTVTAQSPATVDVTVNNSITQNPPETGSLKISKAFDPGQSGFAGTFAINYDCNDGVTHDGTANLAGGGTTTITGIPLGTICTVTEPATPTNPAGWTFGAPTFIDSSNTANDGIVTVTAASPATVNVTVNNTIREKHVDTGSLKITKEFNKGQSGFTGSFTIHYDCDDGTAHDGTVTLEAGETATITGIPLGTVCTVTEPTFPTAPTGWTFQAVTFIDTSGTADDGEVTVTTDCVCVTVHNSIQQDPQLGSVRITKAFSPGASGFAGTFAISFDCNDGTAHDGTVELAAGGVHTITGLPLGTICTITEPTLPAAPAGWTFGAVTFTDSSGTANDGVVTVATTGCICVTVNNSVTQDPVVVQTGSLKIMKVFNAGASGFAGTFAITYNCNDGVTHDGSANLAAGGTTTVTGIPLGTICVVTESTLPSAPAGWTFGAATLTDSSGTLNDGVVTVVAQSPATVDVTVNNTISQNSTPQPPCCDEQPPTTTQTPPGPTPTPTVIASPTPTVTPQVLGSSAIITKARTSGDPAVVGETVVFGVALTITGDTTVTGVTLRDTFERKYLEALRPLPAGCSLAQTSPDADHDTISCFIGDVTPGTAGAAGSKRFDYQFSFRALASTLPGRTVNVVTAFMDLDGPGPSPTATIGPASDTVQIIAILGLQLPPTGDGSMSGVRGTGWSSFVVAGLLLATAATVRIRRHFGRIVR